MRKRLGFALVLGLILAVFVSACGAAIGPVQFTAGGTTVLVPAIGNLHLPALQQPAVAPSLHELSKVQSIAAASALHGEIVSCHGLH